MLSTTRYRQGDIVLVSLPFTDLTSVKKRPALIISPDAFSALKQDLILVAVTSHLAGDDDAVYLDEDDFLDGAFLKKSMVKTAKTFTIHSAIVVKKICRLKPEKLEQVLEAIRKPFSRHGQLFLHAHLFRRSLENVPRYFCLLFRGPVWPTLVCRQIANSLGFV